MGRYWGFLGACRSPGSGFSGERRDADAARVWGCYHLNEGDSASFVFFFCAVWGGVGGLRYKG